MPDMWPETLTAKTENRHEIVLTGSVYSERIKKDGLDKNIFHLTSLNYLNISETCLEDVPDVLSKLVNLQVLVLHSNSLQNIPKTIGKLNKLKNLDVSRNNLTSLPSELSEIQSLFTLNASSNAIEQLPSFDKNTNLAVLNLSNNKISEFPDICYSTMVHLSEIKLEKNSIEEIPSTINALPSLKVLDLTSNKVKIVPGDVADISKLKEIHLKDNPLSDKRFLKLVDQCRHKQIIDYIRQHCPRANADTNNKSKKGGGKKTNKKSDRKSESDDIEDVSHKISVLHVTDSIPKIKIYDSVKTIRPHIVCCIVSNIHLNQDTFRKFIQVQTKLHDSICEKRNAATIATHDLDKLCEGDLMYMGKPPDEIVIHPLMRQKQLSASTLFSELQHEAEAQRKEKKRKVYTGIYKYLYLLEGKPIYPCLLDSQEKVISFPPITNSDITKISYNTKSMLIEVTSGASQNVCRKVLDTLLYDMLFLGIGDASTDAKPDGDETTVIKYKAHSLTVQQVKIVDPDGNLKSVYPSRTDLLYEDKLVSVLRE